MSEQNVLSSDNLAAHDITEPGVAGGTADPETSSMPGLRSVSNSSDEDDRSVLDDNEAAAIVEPDDGDEDWQDEPSAFETALAAAGFGDALAGDNVSITLEVSPMDDMDADMPALEPIPPTGSRRNRDGNDAGDEERDRRHPSQRERIASPPGTAPGTSAGVNVPLQNRPAPQTARIQTAPRNAGPAVHHHHVHNHPHTHPHAHPHAHANPNQQRQRVQQQQQQPLQQGHPFAVPTVGGQAALNLTNLLFNPGNGAFNGAMNGGAGPGIQLNLGGVGNGGAGAFAGPIDMEGFMGFLTGMGVPIMPEREDPERARQMIRALEEVPDGLIRRMSRLIELGQFEEGDSTCAICWEGLGSDGGGFAQQQPQPQPQAAAAPNTNANANLTDAMEGVETADTPSNANDSDGTINNDNTSGGRPLPKAVSLPCAHTFHTACLIPWFSRPRGTTCPTCRFELDPDGALSSAGLRRRHMPNFIPNQQQQFAAGTPWQGPGGPMPMPLPIHNAQVHVGPPITINGNGNGWAPGVQGLNIGHAHAQGLGHGPAPGGWLQMPVGGGQGGGGAGGFMQVGQGAGGLGGGAGGIPNRLPPGPGLMPAHGPNAAQAQQQHQHQNPFPQQMQQQQGFPLQPGQQGFPVQPGQGQAGLPPLPFGGQWVWSAGQAPGGMILVGANFAPGLGAGAGGFQPIPIPMQGQGAPVMGMPQQQQQQQGMWAQMPAPTPGGNFGIPRSMMGQGQGQGQGMGAFQGPQQGQGQVQGQVQGQGQPQRPAQPFPPGPAAAAGGWHPVPPNYDPRTGRMVNRPLATGPAGAGSIGGAGNRPASSTSGRPLPQQPQPQQQNRPQLQGNALSSSASAPGSSSGTEASNSGGGPGRSRTPNSYNPGTVGISGGGGSNWASGLLGGLFGGGAGNGASQQNATLDASSGNDAGANSDDDDGPPPLEPLDSSTTATATSNDAVGNAVASPPIPTPNAPRIPFADLVDTPSLPPNVNFNLGGVQGANFAGDADDSEGVFVDFTMALDADGNVVLDEGGNLVVPWPVQPTDDPEQADDDDVDMDVDGGVGPGLGVGAMQGQTQQNPHVHMFPRPEGFVAIPMTGPGFGPGHPGVGGSLEERMILESARAYSRRMAELVFEQQMRQQGNQLQPQQPQFAMPGWATQGMLGAMGIGGGRQQQQQQQQPQLQQNVNVQQGQQPPMFDMHVDQNGQAHVRLAGNGAAGPRAPAQAGAPGANHPRAPNNNAPAPGPMPAGNTGQGRQPNNTATPQNSAPGANQAGTRNNNQTNATAAGAGINLPADAIQRLLTSMGLPANAVVNQHDFTVEETPNGTVHRGNVNISFGTDLAAATPGAQAQTQAQGPNQAQNQGRRQRAAAPGPTRGAPPGAAPNTLRNSNRANPQDNDRRAEERRRRRREWVPPEPSGPTLRQKVEKKEREAGLRCWEASCGVGPSDEDPTAANDGQIMTQISIKKRAPRLASSSSASSGEGSPLTAQEKGKQKASGSGDLSAENESKEKACEHTFHPSCLVSAVRVGLSVSFSDQIEPDKDAETGEFEVTCPVCRVGGVIYPREWEEGVRALE